MTGLLRFPTWLAFLSYTKHTFFNPNLEIYDRLVRYNRILLRRNSFIGIANRRQDSVEWCSDKKILYPGSINLCFLTNFSSGFSAAIFLDTNDVSCHTSSRVLYVDLWFYGIILFRGSHVFISKRLLNRDFPIYKFDKNSYDCYKIVQARLIVSNIVSIGCTRPCYHCVRSNIALAIIPYGIRIALAAKWSLQG